MTICWSGVIATTLTQFKQSSTKNSCGSFVRGEIFSSERTRNTRKSPSAVVRVLIHALIIAGWWFSVVRKSKRDAPRVNRSRDALLRGRVEEMRLLETRGDSNLLLGMSLRFAADAENQFDCADSRMNESLRSRLFNQFNFCGKRVCGVNVFGNQ